MTHRKIEELERVLSEPKNESAAQSFWTLQATSAVAVLKRIEELTPGELLVEDDDSEFDDDGLYRLDADFGDHENDNGAPFTSCTFIIALKLNPREIEKVPRTSVQLLFDGRREGEEVTADEEVRIEFSATSPTGPSSPGIWRIRQDMDHDVARSESFLRFQRASNYVEGPDHEVPESEAIAFLRTMIDFFVDEKHHADAQASEKK